MFSVINGAILLSGSIELSNFAKFSSGICDLCTGRFVSDLISKIPKTVFLVSRLNFNITYLQVISVYAVVEKIVVTAVQVNINMKSNNMTSCSLYRPVTVEIKVITPIFVKIGDVM